MLDPARGPVTARGPAQPVTAAVAALVLAGGIGPPDIPATPAPSSAAAAIELAATDIVIDIVRHAEDLAPADERIPFSPEFPGAPLSDVGRQQAQHTADQLFAALGGPHRVAGIFSGQDLDAQETAAPFATLQDMIPQLLPGLNELDGGVYANLPITSLGGIMYDLALVAWTLGMVTALPIPGSSEWNGVILNDNYTDAIGSVYTGALADPVISANGEITAAVFSSEASTMIWVLNNVDNPDIGVLVTQLLNGLDSPGGGLPQPLPNAAVVQIHGNPEDGWTLDSWAGQAVSADPGVLTNLFLAWRDLVLPAQTAGYHLVEALQAGDPAGIEAAFETGLHDVSAGWARIPETLADAFDAAVAGNW